MQCTASHHTDFNYEYLLHMEVINSRDAKAGIFRVQTDWFPGAGRGRQGSGQGWAVPQLLWQGCCHPGGNIPALCPTWSAQKPLVFFFFFIVTNPISIIPELLWLCSKGGVLYPAQSKMQVLSCVLLTLHWPFPSGGLGHCKIEEFFPTSSITVCSFSAMWDLPPAFRFWRLTVQWWFTCIENFWFEFFFSPLCSVCFPHLRALLPFARQGHLLPEVNYLHPAPRIHFSLFPSAGIYLGVFPQDLCSFSVLQPGSPCVPLGAALPLHPPALPAAAGAAPGVFSFIFLC